MDQPVPDYLRQDLKIVFVGYNPSLISGETGHHFANATNRFWKVLFLAGLTPRVYQPHEDGCLLELGYGLTNIVARPTRSAAEITCQEYREGQIQLQNKLSYYRPRIVCFVGKGVYLEYSGLRKAEWGIQDKQIVEGVTDFVAPSTSGLVRMRLEELVEIYGLLAEISRKD
ncbi:MAG: mismatch-specific DNA-glycosylase [Bacillota bacterium]|mgnify:FL=1|jgi:TDG/mug DNA glycosylase family protein